MRLKMVALFVIGCSLLAISAGFPSAAVQLGNLRLAQPPVPHSSSPSRRPEDNLVITLRAAFRENFDSGAKISTEASQPPLIGSVRDSGAGKTPDFVSRRPGYDDVLAREPESGHGFVKEELTGIDIARKGSSISSEVTAETMMASFQAMASQFSTLKEEVGRLNEEVGRLADENGKLKARVDKLEKRVWIFGSTMATIYAGEIALDLLGRPERIHTAANHAAHAWNQGPELKNAFLDILNIPESEHQDAVQMTDALIHARNIGAHGVVREVVGELVELATEVGKEVFTENKMTLKYLEYMDELNNTSRCNGFRGSGKGSVKAAAAAKEAKVGQATASAAGVGNGASGGKAKGRKKGRGGGRKRGHGRR